MRRSPLPNSDIPSHADAAPGHRGSAREVFAAFFKLGLTSFGGPIAHLGYFRDELVVRRRWLDEAAYADLVALCQFLPGPASSQVGFALGLRRAGALGALAAWTAFTLPSALLLLLVAYSAGALNGSIGLAIIHGLKLVAVAIVAQAVWGMARTLTPDVRRAAIAVLAAVLVMMVGGSIGQIAAIVVGAALGWLLCRGMPSKHTVPNGPLPSRRIGVACLISFAAILLGVLPFWERLRGWTTAQAALRGTNAAVVGILAAALYDPVMTSAVEGPADFVLALTGFIALTRWSVPPWAVVVGMVSLQVLLSMALATTS